MLFVSLGGEASHLDLCDPKPKAPSEFRGPFAAIETRTPGVRFTELLPRLAQRSDRFSLVRTNINFNGGHRPAGSIGLCGAIANDGGEDANGRTTGYPPSFGAILAQHRGPQPLPGFVSLARGPVGDGVGPLLGYGGGSWGKAYDPFMVSCSDTGSVSIPELKLLDGLSIGRLEHRRTLLTELDQVRRRAEARESAQWTSTMAARTTCLPRPRPTRSSISRARAVRRALDHTSFGQSCLLGRRLVEAGVPSCR